MIAPPGWEDKHAREFLLAHQEVRSQGAVRIPICDYIEVDDTNTKVINKIIDFICDIISPYFQIHKSRLLLNKGNVHMSCPNLMVVMMMMVMTDDDGDHIVKTRSDDGDHDDFYDDENLERMPQSVLHKVFGQPI